MNFKDKIEAAEKDLDQAKSDIAELVGIAEAEERDLSDDESIQLEAMSDNVQALTKRIGDLEKAEQALGAKVVRQKAPAIIQTRGLGKERPKGDLVFKQAAIAFMAHVNKCSPLQILQERYKDDMELETVVKTAVNPAMTNVAGWAQELTDDATRGFLDLLRGESAAAQIFGVAGVNVMFDGFTAIKIPTRAGTALDLASAWTAEGDAIPVQRGTFDSVTLYPYKWGVISTFSKELAMRSSPSIEGLLRQFIIQDTATKLDASFLGEEAAVASVKPAGLFNGVTGTAATSPAGDAAGEMTQDLRNLLDPILAANMGQTLRILMHPSNALAMSSVLTATGVYMFRDELARGTLYGVPVIQSTNLVTDELMAVDAAQLGVSQSTMDFEVSDTATIVEVNDDGTDPTMGKDETPRTPSGTVGDAARDTVNNPPIRSLFQTHSVGIKSTQYMSWAKLRADCVNRITGVAY